MPRFILSVHTSGESSAEPMSPEEMQRGFEGIARLEQEMADAGALVLSARLDPPDAAAVVDARNGKAITTDGPFLESKELVGGFYLIEASDRDAAIGWAAKTSAAIGMPIEVRPILAWHD
jgi:hypothetical protein